MTSPEENGPQVPVDTPKKPKQAKIDLESLPHVSARVRKHDLNPMELLTQRAVALHLKSLDIDFTSSALEELYDLASNYMNGLLQGLQKVTQTQRRFKASPKDLRLLLRDYNIRTSELEDELLRTNKIEGEFLDRVKDLQKISETTKMNILEPSDEIDAQDPSFVFFAIDQDLNKLIPAQHKRNKIIPSYLPEFPPDHTYRKTPKYLNRIGDQKVVRQKIVEESKFGEKALENLINYTAASQIEDDFDEDKNSKDNLKGDGLEEEMVTEENGTAKVDLWSANDKNFDIQAYAKARLAFVAKKEARKTRKLKKVNKEYFDIVGQLSAFGPDEVNETVAPEIYLEKQFKITLQSLKSLKKKKTKRQEERRILQEEEDKKRKEVEAQKKVDVNDFDNFENFENFDNFDSFGGDGSDGEIRFGVEFEEPSKAPHSTVSNHITSEADAVKTNNENGSTSNGTAPETQPIEASTSIIETNSGVTQETETSFTVDNKDSMESTNDETSTLAKESDAPSQAELPPSTAPSTAPVPEDDEDEDEDEDMFDNVPIA